LKVRRLLVLCWLFSSCIRIWKYNWVYNQPHQENDRANKQNCQRYLYHDCHGSNL